MSHLVFYTQDLWASWDFRVPSRVLESLRRMLSQRRESGGREGVNVFCYLKIEWLGNVIRKKVLSLEKDYERETEGFDFGLVSLRRARGDNPYTTSIIGLGHVKN